MQDNRSAARRSGDRLVVERVGLDDFAAARRARAVARPYQAGHAPAGIAERFGGDVSESAGRSDNEGPLSHRRRAGLPR